MKKLLYLLTIAAVFMLGCNKEETKKSTYQIFNNTDKYQSDIQYLDGSFYEVVIYEYFGSDVIKQVNIKKVGVKEKSQKFTADSKTEKIKFSFYMLPKESPYYNLSVNKRWYTVQYFYLNKGKSTVAEVNGQTMLSTSPSKSSAKNPLTIKDIFKEISL